MNEELKIIIRAVTSDAKKNLADVKKELKNIAQQCQETKKSVSEALTSIAKRVAPAMAALTALTAALVTLGKSAKEAQKDISKLNAAFESSGSTTKQAGKTYKELFSFLGDSDRAVETAQNLARITTEEDKLSEYTNILMGVYAKFGHNLPVETISEYISETLATGEVTGELARLLNESGINAEAYGATLSNIATYEEREVYLRDTLNSLFNGAADTYRNANQATLQYNQSQANLNLTLAQASNYTTPFLTEINNLGSTLLTFFGPALQTVSIYLTAFIQLIIEAIQWVGSFFGLFSSNSSSAAADIEGYQKAVQDYNNALRESFGATNDENEKLNDSIKELKKQTMGFDELNIISNPSSTTGGGDDNKQKFPGGKLPLPPNPADYGIGMTDFGFEEIKKDLEEAKGHLKAIAALAASAAAAFLLWKTAGGISFFIKAMKILNEGKGIKNLAKSLKELPKYTKAYYDSMKGEGAWDKLIGKAKIFSGLLIAIAGAVLLVKGYTDAWANGVSLENLGVTLAGIALVATGLGIAFGTTTAGIAALAGGITLVVLGIKDMIENGVSLENILTLVAGAIAVVTGAIMLMGIENTKAVAKWVAHTASLVAHKVATVAVTVAQNALAIAQAALNLVMSLSPLTWIVIAIAAVVAAFVALWVYCEDFRNFWKNLWDNIVEFLKAAGDWIGNFFTVTIPNVFKTVINFIKENWQALLLLIVNPFAGAFKLLYDNCDGFREFIDKWVDKIGQFFKDLWEGIKNTFSSVGKFFKDVFSKAWEGVLAVFSAGGKVFSGIKDGIVTAFKVVVNALIKGINTVVSLPFKGLNGVLDTIHKIEIAGIQPFSWLTWRAPIPQLPKLATGGILTGETLFLGGEGGKKEAVLPLEQNTEWMDILADRIAGRTAAPSKIVLAVDGKELGWASINGINGITRQTGNLQLVLV